MPRELFSPNKTIVPTIPEPIELGGTGATTAIEACQNFNMLSNVELDQVNGAAQLDTNSLIKTANLPVLDISPIPTVSGNMTVYTGQVCKFHITNYDSLRTYDLTAISGSVSLVTYEDFNQCIVTNGGSYNSELPGVVTVCDKAGTIIFTAPNTPGASGFTLNGVTYNLTVLDAHVAKPVILTPTNNAVWNSNSLSVLAQQPVVLGHETTTYTWLLEFELAEDNAFSLNKQTVQTSSLVGFFTSLLPNKLYYVRVRASVPNTYAASEWSNTISFATTHFLDFYETQILSSTNKAALDKFGTSVAISGDGTRLVVGALQTDRNSFTNSGSIYIYVKNGLTWDFEAEITASNPGAQFNFGEAVDINYDGTRIAVGAWQETVDGLTNCGAAYIYVRTGTNWTEEAHFSHLNRQSGDYFGSAIAIDNNGDRVVISAPLRDQTQNASGSIFVFTRTGSSWSQEVEITTATPRINGNLGYYSVGISGNGSKLIVTESNILSGKVYIYKRTDVTWSLEYEIADSDTTHLNYFGWSVAINNDGTRIVFSSLQENSYDGGVYIYDYNGTNWLLNSKIPLTSVPVGSTVGHCVAMNSDGTCIVVGIPNFDSIDYSGRVLVYLNTGSEWHTQILVPSAFTSTGQFGWFVSIDGPGNNCIVGANLQTIDSLNGAGATFVFER